MTRHNQKPDLALRPDDDLSPDGEDVTGQIPHRAMVRHDFGFTQAMRVQNPRKVDVLLKAAVREAELLAEDFVYSWQVKDKRSPTGRSTVEGVAVGGAMVLLRNWGNCAVPVRIVEDTPTHWIFEATFIDMETGMNLQRLFRQRKSERHSDFDQDRALDIAMQIGQSKAIRNVVLNALPQWLIDRAVAASKEAAEARVGDLPKAVASAIAAWAKASVTEDMLVKKIGAPTAAWTARDLVALKTVWNALRDRATTIDAEFPKDEPIPTKTEPTAPSEPAGRQPGED